MPIRTIVFLAVVSLIWIVGHAYIGRRLIPRDRWPTVARRVGWMVVVAFASLPLLAFYSARGGLQFPGFEVLQWTGLWMMGVASVVLVLLLLTDISRTIVRALRRLIAPAGQDQPRDKERRAFFGRVANGAIAASAATTGGVGLAQARQTAEVVDVEVAIDGLPEELDGFTIVQLTDVHVGPTIRRDDLQAMVDRANELGGDIIAVTGDLVDGYVDQLGPQLEPLAQLTAPHGTFFVTGNHEYYWGAEDWCAHVTKLGLRVLNNQHVVLNHDGRTLLLAGVTDHRAGDHLAHHASDPAKARRGAPQCDVSVLLAHQPRSIEGAAAAGYDLQISGHTHGGQYFPMNILVYLAQPYVSGLHRHGPTQIYVSRGTGYWGPPIRFGAPHEITRIRLRPAR